ncbi:F0F1 ATP synthase subunit epsilon [Rhodococcus sp. NPDC059234]|uniref:F0F1 ATP synthase subunit epsilon n=1 Tax=Rhodococcus sp. NPDC059234 TaxID=3346781 RepID=UPI003670B484
MAEMTVELVAVERRLWSGTATLVSAQTTEGEIGIMYGHEPVLGQLVDAGVVAITTTDGERVVAAVHGGFLSVTGTSVTVLAESADFAGDIDVDAAKAVLADTTAEDEAIAIAKGQLRAVERA